MLLQIVSYYHRVSADVEAGAKAIWVSSKDSHASFSSLTICHYQDSKSTTSNVGIEVGTKAYLDNTAFVKAKVNNAGIIALGYTQALRPGVKASFGLAIDSQKLSSSEGVASHKIGTSLVFEA